MSKYIDAERFRMELEKRLKNVRDYMNGAGMKYKGPKYFRAQGRESAYDALLNTIDSLQQEQPIGEEYAIEIGKHTHTLRVGSQSDIDNLIRQEKQEQPEVDLEEEIQTYIKKMGFGYGGWVDGLEDEDLRTLARHFAEWQKEQDKKTIELAEEHAYFAGGINEREKMMEGAVEGEVENATFGIVYLRKNLVNEGYSTGDKVKIIIVKEE